MDKREIDDIRAKVIADYQVAMNKGYGIEHYMPRLPLDEQEVLLDYFQGEEKCSDQKCSGWRNYHRVKNNNNELLGTFNALRAEIARLEAQLAECYTVNERYVAQSNVRLEDIAKLVDQNNERLVQELKAQLEEAKDIPLDELLLLFCDSEVYCEHAFRCIHAGIYNQQAKLAAAEAKIERVAFLRDLLANAEMSNPTPEAIVESLNAALADTEAQ